jgi:hypothetical protein
MEPTTVACESDGDLGRKHRIAAVGTGDAHLARCRSSSHAGRCPPFLRSGTLRGYQNRGEPVPLHTSVIDCLDTWRRESHYNGEDDFLFPLSRNEGEDAGDTRHDSEEDHSPRARLGEDHWKAN